MQFRGISESHRDALVKQRLSLGIAQLDIVISRSKREFLGLVSCRGETAVDIHRSVLSLGFDLHLTVVPRRAVDRIRVVRICAGEERVKWLDDDDAFARLNSLSRSGRRQAQERSARK